MDVYDDFITSRAAFLNASAVGAVTASWGIPHLDRTNIE